MHRMRFYVQPDLLSFYYPNHLYINHIVMHSLPGPEKATALPMFHALTGCDTTSSFFGKGKRTAFETWDNYPDSTATFLTMSCEIVQAVLPQLEMFVVMMYDRTASKRTINECRR